MLNLFLEQIFYKKSSISINIIPDYLFIYLNIYVENVYFFMKF